MNALQDTPTPSPRRARPGSRKRPAPLSRMRLLVLDVDGVLTDGRLRYGPGGESEKIFHVRDGFGIKSVIAAGICVAVISGRNSPAVTRRCRDKLPVLQRLLTALDIPAHQCACVGDDVAEVPLMQQAGLGVAVADAHPAARKAAHRITRLPGGAGAVREICDWLLAARQSA
jgi:3-deoxy-D-manno-octulosonate 8-phosphate phosphatase (KDO 8-P phosphatase)